MRYSSPQTGLKKSLLLAIGIVMITTLAIAVMSEKSGNQDIRSHAALYGGGNTCGPLQTPEPTCFGGRIAQCVGDSWICVTVSGTPSPTPVPIVSGTLSNGQKCGNRCYSACISGIGYNGKCTSRADYCRRLQNPILGIGMQPIQCN